eukprot:SAG31_NODE_324_length_17691_cov_8.128126_4_plen_53_part_00
MNHESCTGNVDSGELSCTAVATAVAVAVPTIAVYCFLGSSTLETLVSRMRFP